MTHLRLMKKPVLETDTQSEWLHVIWAAEELRPGLFVPTEKIEIDTEWSPDCHMAEIYPEAYVIFRKDDTVSIVSRTDEAAATLATVAHQRGINFTP